MKCEICKREFQNARGLCSHIQSHQMNVKEYYDKYLKRENDGVCLECKKDTKFNGLSGYNIFCSVKCAHNSQEVKNKTIQTNIEKYGGTGFQVQSLTEKYRNTCLEKYGVNHYSQTKQFLEKCEKTCLQKHNIDHYSKSEDFKRKVRQTWISKFLPQMYSAIEVLNLELLDNYMNAISIIKVRCKKCNSKFNTTYFNLSQGDGKCPICYPRGSREQREVLNFIRNLGILDILENDKTILENKEDKRKSKELDIYIPSLKVAIEYDGLYFHDEDHKDKNYHLSKTLECEKLGIRLIHIFEDEWNLKQEIVKSRLKQILNKSNSQKLMARKCQIKEIASKEKDEFLERFHIQGKDISKVKLGAFYNDELVSVMTFSHGSISKGMKNKDYSLWELNRFCTNSNYHIPGIAGKLLSHFKKNYEWKEIYSYADRRWSQGNLYYKLEFQLDHITSLNYWYTKGMKRIHRFNLRKRPDEPKDISESILRLQEGYSKVWDCGNLKFILKNKTLI